MTYDSLICAHPDRGLFASQRAGHRCSGCLASGLACGADELATEAGGPLRRALAPERIKTASKVLG